MRQQSPKSIFLKGLFLAAILLASFVADGSPKKPSVEDVETVTFICRLSSQLDLVDGTTYTYACMSFMVTCLVKGKVPIPYEKCRTMWYDQLNFKGDVI